MAAQALKPNVLITGTPGTGKTTMAEMLSVATGLNHVNLTEIVRLQVIPKLFVIKVLRCVAFFVNFCLESLSL